MAVDDLDLNRDGTTPRAPAPAESGTWNRWMIGAAVVLAVLGGALARWGTTPETAGPPAASAPAAASVADAPTPVDTPLPPLGDMDPFLRTLLGSLTARPELAAWLATDDLIHQMAFTIDRVSRGASPASELGVLAPATDFTVTRAGRVRRMDEASFRRYDGLADAVASVDAAQVARAYRTIRPRLAEAYASLGRPEASVDVAVQQALDVLIATPIPEGPLELVEGKGAVWAYADTTLEALDPAQKHLLRMGPRNAARVIETLTRVRAQLPS
jgi:Protein of unknown function (DUF3014)